MKPDLVIRNGTVFDCTGAEGVVSDVDVAGGFVIACGDLPESGLSRGRRDRPVRRSRVSSTCTATPTPSIAAERHQDPLDAVYDLMLASADELHSLMVIIECYSEEQQRRVFSHPLCMPASDATTLAVDGPLAGSSFHGAYTRPLVLPVHGSRAWAALAKKALRPAQGRCSPESVCLQADSVSRSSSQPTMLGF